MIQQRCSYFTYLATVGTKMQLRRAELVALSSNLRPDTPAEE